jgi:hypothetical protein
MDFEDFWRAYPRRIAKFAARTAWDRAVKIASPEQIIDGAKKYARWLGEPGWKPHPKYPATWLNAGCWMDELDSAPQFNADEYRAQLMAESKAREDARRWKEQLAARLPGSMKAALARPRETRIRMEEPAMSDSGETHLKLVSGDRS